jgi:hypothetical protein
VDHTLSGESGLRLGLRIANQIHPLVAPAFNLDESGMDREEFNRAVAQ